MKRQGRKLPEINVDPLQLVEMHTERFGAQFRATIVLNNGEEREAIGETAAEAQRNAMLGLELDWSFSRKL